jgi:flap endonuclease-1
MGINISDIIPRKEIQLEDLKGNIIAIDAFNTIYQFLTTIRQMDGTPLMDKKGRITSHLSGLFYRNLNLLVAGVKPVYVFDGKPPELKEEEIKRRMEAKQEAKEKYEEAKAKGDTEAMRRFSAQFTRITDEIIAESKELLSAMGIPVIQALGEGEAEAAHLSRNSLAWASASQDYDSLLYGATRLVRNLTLARKRKTSSGAYVDVNIELIEFESLLNQLQINKDQLICLGILVGTDYNPGGVKGIGQKTALEIVRKYQYPVAIFDYIKNSPKFSSGLTFDWQEIYKQFHEYKCCSTTRSFDFKQPDKEKIREILSQHDFSEERISSALQKLDEEREKGKQKKLFT